MKVFFLTDENFLFFGGSGAEPQKFLEDIQISIDQIPRAEGAGKILTILSSFKPITP